MSTKENMRDLGVTFSSDGSYKNHIQNIVKTSLRTLGFINRLSTNFKNPNTFLRLFYTLVRPTLEYVSCIRSPQTLNEIRLVESIQKKFLRRLAYLSGNPMQRTDHDYSNIKSNYEIMSLRQRRHLSDLHLLHNIINKKFNCAYLHENVYLMTHARYLRVQRLFFTELYRHSKYANNTVNRICTFGNRTIDNILHLDMSLPNFVNVYKQLLADN